MGMNQPVESTLGLRSQEQCLLEECKPGPGATVSGVGIETQVYAKIKAVHRFT